MPNWIRLSEAVVDLDCFSDFCMDFENDHTYSIICTYKVTDKATSDLTLFGYETKKEAIRDLRRIMRQANRKNTELKKIRSKLTELEEMIAFAPGSARYQMAKSHFEAAKSIE